VTRRITTRRVAAAAGIALAMLALSACRQSRDVAAYVGDTTITEEQLTTLAKPYEAQLSRDQVLQFLVADKLCTELTADAGVSVPAPAQTPPPGTPELAVIYNHLQSCIEVLPSQPVEATEADLREVFDNLVAEGAYPPGTNFDEIKAEFAGQANSEQVGLAAALGKRKALYDALNSKNVTVNPRYDALRIPILVYPKVPTQEQPEQLTLLLANLNSRLSAVTEAPASSQPVPSEAPAAN
jgi:hypothetical protein